MNNITLASYRTAARDLDTTPLSCALPAYYTDEEIAHWEEIPSISDTMHQLTAPEKMAMAHNLLDRTFLVFPDFLTLVHSCDRMLHRTSEDAQNASIMILSGHPGSGKKTAIRHILSHYPALILHTGKEDAPAPMIQIPCLYVSLPPDHSLAGLKASMQKALRQTLEPLMTVAALPPLPAMEMQDLLHIFHTALLIVDLRYLPNTAPRIHTMTDYLSSLVQTGTSVLLITSEEQAMLISANLADAMDLQSEPRLRFHPLSEGPFYDQWIRKLWNCLLTAGPALTSGIADKLLHSCYGNQALILRSLKDVQTRALSIGHDTFTEDDLRVSIHNCTAEMDSLAGEDKAHENRPA